MKHNATRRSCDSAFCRFCVLADADHAAFGVILLHRCLRRASELSRPERMTLRQRASKGYTASRNSCPMRISENASFPASVTIPKTPIGCSVRAVLQFCCALQSAGKRTSGVHSLLSPHYTTTSQQMLSAQKSSMERIRSHKNAVCGSMPFFRSSTRCPVHPRRHSRSGPEKAKRGGPAKLRRRGRGRADSESTTVRRTTAFGAQIFCTMSSCL